MNFNPGITVDVENYDDLDLFVMSLEALPPIGAKFEIGEVLWVVEDVVWMQYAERNTHWRPCIKFKRIGSLKDGQNRNTTEQA